MAIDKTTLQYLGLGPYDVHVVPEIELDDTSRDRRIPYRLYVPKADGPLPVIVFSHGAGDSNASSPILMRHWASHGFVVILPFHFYGERPIIERSVGRIARELARAQFMGPPAWIDRTRDMTYTLDSFDAFEAQVPELAGRIDRHRVGTAGHSFGAYTVMLLGGATMTDRESGEVFHFSDPRPKAILMISGPGRDHFGLNDASWEEFNKPLIVYAGSHDPNNVFGDPMWRAEPFTFAPPGDKYLVFIKGAHHMSYIGPIIDVPFPDPAKRGAFRKSIRRSVGTLAKFFSPIDQIGIFDFTRISSVAFWNAYLNDDDLAKRYLTSGALERFSGRRARIDAK